MSAIEVTNLVKTFRSGSENLIRAVDGVSFKVERGEIFGLLGPNGAGKSTIVRMLTTIVQPTSGSARILDHDVVNDPLNVRKEIAVVLQETAVETLLSVRDNLHIYGRLHGLSTPEIQRRAARVLDQFDLKDKQKEKAQDLSIGMRRRLQVAKVFMVDSPILFLDEATTGMDPIIKRQTLDSIRDLSRQARTIFLTTQLLEEAEALCDHIVILNHGKSVASGNLERLRTLTKKRFHVSLSFDSDKPEAFEALRSLDPLSLTADAKDAEMQFEGEEAAILEQLSKISQQFRIERFEIRGISLEEIFVELMERDA
jgi:ABC-type multidrug transport system ATPase subunit